MELASRSSRLLGQVIDGLIAITPFITTIFVVDPETTLGTTVALATMAFGAGYYLFADALPEGQSWGKLLLGLAVIDEHSKAPCTGFQSFVRNILQPILGALDWIFIIGRRRQRLGDLVAGTIVVEKASIGVEKRWSEEFHSSSREWVSGALLGGFILLAVVAAVTVPDSDAVESNLAQPAPDAPGRVQASRVVLARDGGTQITVPESWSSLPTPNELLQLKVGNGQDRSVATLTDAKSGIPDDVDLESYARLSAQDMQSRMPPGSTISEPVRMTIQGNSAIQYEITDRTDPPIIAWVTAVETSRNYHRVIATAGLEGIDESRPMLQEVIHTFRETSQQPTAAAPR